MPHPDPRASDNPPTESARAANVVTIGDKASVDQIAVGENITQIKGYSAAEVTLLLTRIQTEYRPKPFDGRSPYIGLESFQERDADRFFGRENLIADLSARVMNSAATNARAVFVAGPSGSGKSSLVRAGLVPALRRDANSEHWLYETMKPGREPLAELKRVVGAFAQSPKSGNEFFAQALTESASLHEWVNIALGDETARRALIVLDQFEEIFTQLPPEREAERAAVLNLLTHAATVENGRTLVVFTLRSDFVTNCASYPALNALVNQQFLQVGAMSPDELVSAIARPALQVGLRLDPALISQIINDVRGEPGALPLMQFALKDLFDADQDKGELTLDGYLKRGGLHEALERHADAEFEKLDDTEKQLARSVFSGLIEIGRGREDTKRTAIFQDLVPAGADAARVQALVRELADARLITTDQQGDKEIVTLAHERLITAWAWLQDLVNKNREVIALQNEIAQDAGEWDKSGRDASYLYRGARLAIAQEKLQGKQLVLSGLAQEFIDTAIQAREAERAESEAARQRELEKERQRADAEKRARRAAEQRSRVLRFAIVGVSLFALAAILASVFAFQQQQLAQQQAKLSESRRLAAQSVVLHDDSFDKALLLAIESVAQDRNFDVRNNLVKMMQQNQLNITLHGHADAGIAVAWSPDGRRVATSGRDNTIRVWDVATGKEIGSPIMGFTDPVRSLIFSPDGKILASAGCGRAFNATRCSFGEIRLWDVETLTQIGEPLAGHVGNAGMLAFRPDGAVLASGGCAKQIDNVCQQGQVLFWDMARRQLSSVLELPQADVNSLAFTPDGKQLLTSSYRGAIAQWDMTHNPPKLIQKTTIPIETSNPVFSPNGKILATTRCQEQDTNGNCIGGEIRFYDLNGKRFGAPITGHRGSINSIAFSLDGKKLASGSSDKTIQVWDVQTHRPSGEPMVGHSDMVFDVAFSPDGKAIASVGADRTLRLWTQPSGIQLNSFDVQPRGVLKQLVVGQNGILFAATQYPSIYIVNTLTGDIQSESLPTSAGITKHLAFTSNGELLAFTRCPDQTQSESCTQSEILVWSVSNRNFVGTPFAVKSDSPITGLAFSPDGQLLASGNCLQKNAGQCVTGEIRIWNVAEGKTIQGPLSIQGDAASAFAFSHDRTMFASAGGDGVIQLWRLADAKPIGNPLRGHLAGVNSLAFSPDDAQLVSASYDRSLRLWDTKQATPIGGPLTGHIASVETAAFSPDGKMLASASLDKTIRLWDVAAHQSLGIPLEGDPSVVLDVSIAPDKPQLASANEKTIYLWNILTDPLDLRDRGCKIINRNLTRHEYAEYINPDPAAYDTVYAKNPTCPGLSVEPLPTPTPSPTP